MHHIQAKFATDLFPNRPRRLGSHWNDQPRFIDQLGTVYAEQQATRAREYLEETGLMTVLVDAVEQMEHAETTAILNQQKISK